MSKFDNKRNHKLGASNIPIVKPVIQPTVSSIFPKLEPIIEPTITESLSILNIIDNSSANSIDYEDNSNKVKELIKDIEKKNKRKKK
jgi:hypothetical protein